MGNVIKIHRDGIIAKFLGDKLLYKITTHNNTTNLCSLLSTLLGKIFITFLVYWVVIATLFFMFATPFITGWGNEKELYLSLPDDNILIIVLYVIPVILAEALKIILVVVVAAVAILGVLFGVYKLLVRIKPKQAIRATMFKSKFKLLVDIYNAITNKVCTIVLIEED